MILIDYSGRIRIIRLSLQLLEGSQPFKSGVGPLLRHLTLNREIVVHLRLLAVKEFVPLDPFDLRYI